MTENKTYKMGILNETPNPITTTTYAGSISIKEREDVVIIKPFKQESVELSYEQMKILLSHLEKIVGKRKLMENL